MTIKYYHDLVQGTDEWLEARLGIVTASVAKQLITPTFKISKGDKIKALAYELAAQRITGRIADNFMSWDMERGHIEEGLALDAYAKKNPVPVACGFVTNDELGFVVGASPDGLIPNAGCEVKSRQSKFQVMTIIENKVPAEYMVQIQLSMWVSGRAYWDFIQFSNGMPLFVERVYPMPSIMGPLIEALIDFENTVVDLVATYKKNAEGLTQTVWVDHHEQENITVSGE